MMAVARVPSVLAGIVATLSLAGCGNFWQNPYSTSSGNTNGTATTTTLAASANSVAVGASITLTATVSPSAATGTVTFLNGSATLGTGSLSAGTATFLGSFSSAGAETITASYGGDSTYASSTSNAVTVTVTSSGSQRNATESSPGRSGLSLATLPSSARSTSSPAILATGAFSARYRTFAATNAEAAVVEGHGSISLDHVGLSGAAGSGRGVLLYSASSAPGKTVFSMTGGSLVYICDAEPPAACRQGSATKTGDLPPALFSVANTSATISLEGVTVINDALGDGEALLAAGAMKSWGTSGSNGGQMNLRARGTDLKGDVIADRLSAATLSLLADQSGQGSTLTGAIDSANSARSVNLALDRQSLWIVTADSHVTDVSGLLIERASVWNIDGGGHCVYYSGKVNGSRRAAVYSLDGGGYLAPAGSRGLHCN